MTRAIEAWLTSEDPEKFAKAAMCCEHQSGFCIHDGFCHQDGVCFRSERGAMTAACRRIEAAAADEPADIAGKMAEASALLRRSWEADRADQHGQVKV